MTEEEKDTLRKIEKESRSINYYVNHGRSHCPICEAKISNGLPMLSHLRKHVREKKLTENPYLVDLGCQAIKCFGFYSPDDGEMVTFVSFKHEPESDRAFERLVDEIKLQEKYEKILKTSAYEIKEQKKKQD